MEHLLCGCENYSAKIWYLVGRSLTVTDSGKGLCVDPGEKEAILEAGGPGPPGEGKGGQLASDSGGG
jgi:hypothetical protein